MRNNRIISLILAVTLILSNIPVISSAQDSAGFYEQLLGTATVQELYGLMAGNSAGTAALSLEKLAVLKSHAATLYANLDSPSDEEQACYNALINTISNQEALLSGGQNNGSPVTPTPTDPPTAPEPVQTEPLYNKLVSAVTMKDIHDLLMGDTDAAYALNEEELASVKFHTELIYAELSDPTADDKAYYELIISTLDHLISLQTPPVVEPEPPKENTPDTLEEPVVMTKEEAIAANFKLLVWKSKGQSGSVTVTVNGTEYVVTTANYSEVYSLVYDILLTYTDTWTDITSSKGISGTKIWDISHDTLNINATLTISSGDTLILLNSGSLKDVSFGPSGKIVVEEGGILSIQGREEGKRVSLNAGGNFTFAKNGLSITNTSGQRSVENMIHLKEGSVYMEYATIKNSLAPKVSTSRTSGALFIRNYQGTTNIPSLVKVYASDVVFQKCAATSAGAVYSDGIGSGSEIYFYNSTFDQCVARGKPNNTGGGAVRAGSGSGVFTFQNCRFTNNLSMVGPDETSQGNNGGGAVRWAVGNLDTPTGYFNNCTFTNNKADGRGGAIMTFGGMVLEGCTLTGNKATVSGGAIFAACHTQSTTGAATDANGSITLGRGTVISGNSVVTSLNSSTPAQNGGRGLGGAVHFQIAKSIVGSGGVRENYDLLLYIDGATISGNTAENGGAIAFSVKHNYNCGLFIKEGSVIEGNTATENGGAVYIDSNSVYGKNQGFNLWGGTVQNNTATENGGAIYLKNGSLAMSGGSILSNTATINGGAAYITGGNFTMTGGTLGEENAANTAVLGGGVYVAGGSATVSGGTVQFNTATDGAGIYVNGGSAEVAGTGRIAHNTATADGGGSYINGGDFKLDGDGAVIESNAAQNGAGVYLSGGQPNLYRGTLKDNIASKNGGGIYIDQQKILLQPTGQVSITGNQADQGAGLFIGGTNGTDAGFQVGTSTGTVQIADNIATGENGNGGGVCISKGYFELDAENIALQRNRAENGGAVAVLSGNFTMKGGSIGGTDHGNTATNGGAVYVNGGDVELSGGIISANTAAQNGGGIAVNNGAVYMSGGAVSSNKATSGDGGGIYVSSTGTTPVYVKVFSGTLSGNSAAKSGGAVAVNGADGTITVETGVNADHSTLPISHSDHGKDYSHAECPVITNNTSSRSGGAFYVSGNSTTHLKLYCLTGQENKTSGDLNPLNENMSNFMMVEGGTVYISTANTYSGVEGKPDVDSPSGDNVYGNMTIHGSIHVVGGALELFGSKDNPRLLGALTIDLQNSTDRYIDHRTSLDKLTISYHENFFRPDGTPDSAQTAFDVTKDGTHTIYAGLYAHDGYKFHGWNINKDATTGTADGWYPAANTYTFHMPDAEHPDQTLDGNNFYGDLTLYAIWKVNGYNVKFVSGIPENETWSGNEWTEVYNYDSEEPLPANRFIWSGHVFTGWEVPGEDEIRQPGYPVMNLTTENAATVIVTAQWALCDHPQEHQEYALSGTDTLTKTCNQCHYSATARLSAQNAVYDGQNHTATLECSDPEFWKDTNGQPLQIQYEGLTIRPQNAPADWTAQAVANPCVSAGAYTASITGGAFTASVNYTIAKAKQDAPKSRPTYVQPTGTDTTLTVNQLPSNERISSQSNAHVQYIIRYYEDGNQTDDIVPIPTPETDALSYTLSTALRVYSVLASYPETDDYLASELISAELSFLFNATLHLTFQAGDGIDCWLGQVKQGDKEEQVLFVKLRTEQYYLEGDDFTFLQTVTQPENSTYDGLKITKSNTIANGYILSATSVPTDHTYITTVIGGAKPKATLTAEAKEKQIFSDFAGVEKPVISRNSAFTVRFDVTGYDAAAYQAPALHFSTKDSASLALPANTSIILRDRSTGSYWYTTLSSATDTVALGEFKQMVASRPSYTASSGDLNLQFIVDFSRCSAPLSEDNLICTFSAQKTEQGVHAPDLSKSVEIGLAGYQISLGEFSGAGLTQVADLKFAAGGEASKYDHRDIALVLTPTTPLPLDASIRCTIDGYNSTCRPDKDGNFFIPLGDFRYLDTQLTLELNSDMFPEEKKTYTLTGELYLSQTDAELAPLNEPVLNTVDVTFESNLHKSGIRISVDGDKRLFTTAEDITAVVKVEPLIFDLFYNVVVELHQELDGDTFGDTTLIPDQNGSSYTFDLTGRPTGDYCIVASLQTKAGYTIHEARYYFIIYTAPTD